MAKGRFRSSKKMKESDGPMHGEHAPAYGMAKAPTGPLAGAAKKGGHGKKIKRGY